MNRTAQVDPFMALIRRWPNSMALICSMKSLNMIETGPLFLGRVSPHSTLVGQSVACIKYR
jgi:hypothetical protein